MTTNEETKKWNVLETFEKFSVDQEKAKEEFRNYEDSTRQSIVEWHYREMRTNQTFAFVDRMFKKWHSFDKAEMTIREAFEKLESYVDSSDPDCDFPNLEHNLQTAIGIREAGHPEWFQLVGLLHDMGKIMFALGGLEKDGQHGHQYSPQWALGGDTWVVGAKIPDTVVFPEMNRLNGDYDNESYNTKFGVYKPGCGFENLRFAYGHDEYMYQMLKFNKCAIPEEGLAMIRYHSCYPWHSKNEYDHFMSEKDHYLKKWVQEFNQFDLYTKSDKRPDVKKEWPYWQKLIDKYCPGMLRW